MEKILNHLSPCGICTNRAPRPVRRHEPQLNAWPLGNMKTGLNHLKVPAMVSRETVDKNIRLTYGPYTHGLAQTVITFDSASEVNTLKVDKGGC